MMKPLQTTLNAFAERQKPAGKDKAEPQLLFKAVGGLDILHLGGWHDNMAALRKAISEACGLSIEPKTPTQASENKDFTLLPIGFEKYRLLGKQHNIPKALQALPIDSGTAISVSHSFCLLQISGTAVRDFLPLLLTIDTSEDGFKAGSVAITAYHHAAVLLHRSALQPEIYTLHLAAGTAQSLCESILETASSFAVKIEV